MRHFCYCYEVIQALNVYTQRFIEIHKNTDLMAMCDSI